MEDPTFPIPYLANELIVEILTWLPVKSLLKFKCVCKSWRAIISSQRFVKSHLEKSKLDRNFTSQRLLMQEKRIQGDNFLMQNRFKQLSANSMLHEPVSEAFDLISPFQLDGEIKAVLGSCNGLLCLGGIFPSEYYLRTELILWNPSTRIRKVLPDSGKNGYSFGDLITNFGFGYDKSSDDYKVLRIIRSDYDSSHPEVILQVYSLRNDQWKTKPLGIPPMEMTHPATLVNGKLYWIVSDIDGVEAEEFFVFCFDLETEGYAIVGFPNGIGSKDRRLGECGGSLRLMGFDMSGSDVWSFDGCGYGSENWAKVARVPSVEDVYEFCVCVLYVMNSPVLVLGGGSIAIFDAKDGSIRYHEIRDTGDFRVRGAYIESLVSPLG